jgi:alkylation response protein AidB-like acyl-CoA dehydrogenase
MRSEELELAVKILRKEVAPRAELIDRDSDELRTALDALCRAGLMALKRPREFGGPEMSEEEFRTFQEEVARTSGSLAFLQTQHQSAVSLLAKSQNERLKAEYLPRMASGDKLVGIGFSQLRRSGPPIMRATPTDDGAILEGHVPWVTGYSFYPEFIIGASLPSGEAVFGMVPLQPQAGVRVSPPMRLAAMESAMTVTVDFDRFLLRHERTLFIKPRGWIRNNDRINIALQGHFAIGCAQAGLDILRKNADRKDSCELRAVHDLLIDEMNRLREATQLAQRSVDEETTQARLEVRAWAIEFAVRCAHAAVTSSSGAANSADHPAQRVYREALVYTVSAQTQEIMEATLRRLARDR